MLRSKSADLLATIDSRMRAYENEIELLKSELGTMRHRERHVFEHFKLAIAVARMSEEGTLGENLDKPTPLKRLGNDAKFILGQLDNKQEFQHRNITIKYL